ncbi:MAG: hypothetical protein ACTSXW_06085 [Candidatus Baldrarchaeia archaeon]
MPLLKRIVDGYMRGVSGISELCDRCLRTESYDGSVVLMVIDTAFTSIGLNYFTAVVPKVLKFRKRFVVNEKIRSLRDLVRADIDELRSMWKNSRSWHIARGIAYLSTISGDDRTSLRSWARNAWL